MGVREPQIDALLKRQRVRLLGSAGLLLALLVVPLVIATQRLAMPAWGVIAALMALLAALAAWIETRFAQCVPANLARHLDRRLSALEDSADLLLADPQGMSVLQRLQRQRVADQLQRITASRLPVGVLVWPKRDLVTGLAVSIALLLAVLIVPGPDALDGVDAGAASNASSRLRTVSVTIQPPVYSGLPERVTQVLDVDAEEGGQIIWELGFDAAIADLRLTLDDGTELLAQGVGGRRHRFTLDAFNDHIYRLRWRDGGGDRFSDYHRIRLLRDQAPELAVVQPRKSPESVPEHGVAKVEFVVEARDDYAVGEAQILATVAKGEGEGVKFRDVALPFDMRRDGGDGTVTLVRDWDLLALGMAPGDELYFRAVVGDNRRPRVNRSRTPMMMIRWETEEKSETLAIEGIAVDLIPEYFRSQRQIIIDTEKLIADAANIGRAEGMDRSRSLAFDQKALRLRYGQYLGEEYSTEIGYSQEQINELVASANTEGGDSFADHLEHQASEQHGHAGDDHDEAEHGPVSASVEGLPDFMASFVHVHDSAEQATLFDDKTRDTLKQALSAMWSAELELHLSRPQQALPHEYTALRLLKEVQQANRIYVRRAGFEPPPLDPGRRLSGELDEARGADLRWPGTDPGSDPGSAERRMLALLMNAASRSEMRPALAYYRDRIKDDSDAIDVRLDLIRLLGGSTGGDCPGCLERIRAHAWSAMPSPVPAPTLRAGPLEAERGRDYLERIDGGGANG